MAVTEPMTDEEERARIAAQIAKSNDIFRKILPCGGHINFPGKYIITQGIHAEGPEFSTLAQLAVAGDANFTDDNDPCGITVSAPSWFAEKRFCGRLMGWMLPPTAASQCARLALLEVSENERKHP